MIYNYILGFDTEDNNWFHNVEAESLFMNSNPVYDPNIKQYRSEYCDDGTFLPLTDDLMLKFYKKIIELNKLEEDKNGV
jgi:hypothetical protein